MNYRKVYNALIEKAQKRIICNEYQEIHHILPKSMGGSNNADNLVSLTAREHFIAHVLLAHIHDNNQMSSALIIMKGRKNGYFNSRLYEIGRKKKSKSIVGNQYAKGLVVSDHAKLAVIESNKRRIRTVAMEEKCTFAGKTHSDEHKAYMSQIMKNRVFSDETRQKMKDAQKKRFALNPISNETKAKMSQSKRNNHAINQVN